VKIKVRKKGKVQILELRGNLTGDGEMEQKVREVLEAGGRLFIFNMAEVPFIDSVGLCQTISCTKRIRERGGSVKLMLADGGKVQEILKITGLDKVYDIFSDEEEAIASWIS